MTGGAVTAVKGRIDFCMPEAPEDKLALQLELQNLIDRDLPVTQDWITDTELDAKNRPTVRIHNQHQYLGNCCRENIR